MSHFEDEKLSMMDIFKVREDVQSSTNFESLHPQERLVLREHQKKKQKMLEESLSDKEKSVYYLSLENRSYQEMMEALKVADSRIIDNAIQRVKRKIGQINELKQKIDALTNTIGMLHAVFPQDVFVYASIPGEEIERFEQFYGFSIPMPYRWLLTEIGNGFKVFDVELYPLHQTFTTKKIKKEKPLKFFKNKKGKDFSIVRDEESGIYYIGDEQSDVDSLGQVSGLLEEINGVLEALLEEKIKEDK